MNHLSPVEILKATVSTGEKKASGSFKKLFLLGVLAGAYIAFAGAGSATCSFNLVMNTETFGVGKALSGAIFAGGLIMVLLAGGELFTGNSLMTAAALEKRIKLDKLLRNWVIVYISNFIGAVLVAFLISQTTMLNGGAGYLGAFVLKTAVGKVNMTFMQCFVSGILCNWLVSLAVWMATGAGSTSGKVAAAFFPIWIFVTCGFEHCVANMYFIPSGLFVKANETFVALSGVANEALANLTWGGMILNNLVPVTIGNIVGGGLLVACIYLYALKTKEQ